MTNLFIDKMLIEDVELFVFDKDGTIINLANYWFNMVELRAKEICSCLKLDIMPHKYNLMDSMGIDLGSMSLKPQGPVGLLPREAVQKAAESYLEKIGLNDVSGVCFDAFKNADLISLSSLNKLIKPLDGAVNLLYRIKNKKCKIAIATTDKTERANIAVKFLKIEKLIDLVVGADKIRRSKPDPEMLMYIGSALGIQPSSSIMVGDALTDIQMGVNARFKASIGVCGGLTDRNGLLALTPYVVNNISEIKVE